MKVPIANTLIGAIGETVLLPMQLVLALDQELRTEPVQSLTTRLLDKNVSLTNQNPGLAMNLVQVVLGVTSVTT